MRYTASWNHLLQNEIQFCQLFLIAVINISSVINDIPQDSIVTSKHRRKKSGIKRSKCPINYYANFVASCNLILSGDVELNPGPGSVSKIMLRNVAYVIKKLLQIENM